jgi:transposase
MVAEHRDAHGSQWAAIQSIASKIGCTSESLRRWVQQAERDQGVRAGLSTSDRERLKQLERENRELSLGRVGAVAAREVSRFARNSREWQQLVEVCRIVDTVLIEQEMVYAPRASNDRRVRSPTHP